MLWSVKTFLLLWLFVETWVCIILKISKAIKRASSFLFYDASYLVCAIYVVSFGRFNKTESIYVTNVRFSFRSEQVESTYPLFEGLVYLSSNLLFLLSEHHRVSYFLSIIVSLHNSIQCWTFSCLSMCIIRTY